MNILTKSLDELKYRIPIDILQAAFREEGNYNYHQAPISLDEIILNKVIRQRVIHDTNIVGGQTILVPLINLPTKYIDSHTIIYEIPAELVSNRTIMSVLSVGYIPYGFNAGGLGVGSIASQSVNDLTLAAQRVNNSFSNVPNISTSSVELIGYNTVMIKDTVRVVNNYTLRCVVANEENLNNINPRSHLVFAKLVELAVKSYIYNKLIIRMDTAYLHGGQELGMFKTIVEGYSDSEEMYQTHLHEVWRPAAYMNDQVSHERFIKIQINPGI